MKNIGKKGLGIALILLILGFMQPANGQTVGIVAAISPASPQPLQYPAGTTDVTLSVIRLTNSNSSPISTITGFQIISDQDTNTIFSSVKVYDGTTMLGNSISTFTNSSGVYTATISVTNFSIPGYSYKDLTIKGDVGSQPNRTVNLRMGVGGINFNGSANTSGLPVYGNSMQIATPTSNVAKLNLTLHTESPLTKNYYSGDTEIIFAQLRLAAIDSSVTVSSITLYADSNPADLVTNLKLYDGATALSSTSFTFANNVYSMAIPVSLSISDGAYKFFTIKGDAPATPNRYGSLRLGIGNVVSTAGTFTGAPSYGYAMNLSPKVVIPPPPPTLFPNPVPPPANPPAATLKDGDVVLDRGTIYVIENNKKRGVTSMTVFNRLGYNSKQIKNVDTTSLSSGEVIASAEKRHVRGAVVSDRGTIYFLGTDLRYPFPSAAVFLSWGHSFDKVIPANSYDLGLTLGPVVQAK